MSVFAIYAEVENPERVGELITEFCWQNGFCYVAGCNYDDQGPHFNPRVIKIFVRDLEDEHLVTLAKEYHLLRITRNFQQLWPLTAQN